MGCCEFRSDPNVIEVNLTQLFANKAAAEAPSKTEYADFRDISLTSENTPTVVKRNNGAFLTAGLESSFLNTTNSADSAAIKLLTPKFKDMPRSSPKLSFASNPTMLSEEHEGSVAQPVKLSHFFDTINMPEHIQECPHEVEVTEYSPTYSPEKTVDKLGNFKLDSTNQDDIKADLPPKSVKEIVKNLDIFFAQRGEAKISALDLSLPSVDRPIVTGRRPRTFSRSGRLF